MTVTGPPGMTYISAMQLQDHVHPNLLYPFSATGTLCDIPFRLLFSSLLLGTSYSHDMNCQQKMFLKIFSAVFTMNSHGQSSHAILFP